MRLPTYHATVSEPVTEPTAVPAAVPVPDRRSRPPGVAPILIDALTKAGNGYRFVVAHDGRLHQLAFGLGAGSVDIKVGRSHYPLALPTYGEDPHRVPALRVTHADGVMSTRLTYQAHTTTATEGGQIVRITLTDAGEPLDVVIVVRVWDAYDLVEQWIEITNQQTAPITVHDYASSSTALAGVDPHLTHMGGGWLAEWTAITEPLSLGTKVVESLGGIRPHLHAMPYALVEPAGPASETEGSVFACAIEWVGNTRLSCERTHNGVVRVSAGANPYAAERRLDPSESFRTPAVLWTWSDVGRGPLSRRLHRFAREQVVRNGTSIRATVMNNWEATFFAFDEDKLLAMIDDAASIGAELFLLDDGWFGESHPRDLDDAGLGDWVVDRRKLPNGIEALTTAAAARGIRFGLWVEPEMVNPQSSLYGEHPDWVVSEPTRDRREERNQLALDLCRPDVRTFVVDTVTRILHDHPGISYVKWDANRAVSEPGSSALPSDRQSHWPFDSAAGTHDVMASVAAANPHTEIMLCASGGGRFDLGSLRHFNEVWTSDNTDPVARLQMQWAAGWFLPASILCAHVTKWGGKPLAFGCAVAMTGRFGIDLDTTSASAEDLAVLRRSTAAYHRVRDLVQQGDLYRLQSPLTGQHGAVACLSPDRDRAVVFAFQIADVPGTSLLVDGLDPNRNYVVAAVSLTDDTTPSTRVMSGEALLREGLEWPLDQPLTAAIFEVSAVD